MTSKLLIGGMASAAFVVGALAFSPMLVNAQATAHTSGSGVGLRDGTGNRSSNSGYQASIDARAKAVGMSATELTEALKTKTMDDILNEKKISFTDYQAAMATASKARWESKGLSAEEVQKRVDWQSKRQSTATHDGTTHSQGGYGRQNMQ